MSSPSISSYPADGITYLLSNEFSIEKIQHLLEVTKKSPGAVHIGVSGWQNYDMIVVRDSDQAVLVDINDGLCSLHRLTKDVIETAENVDVFIDKFLKNLYELIRTLKLKINRDDIRKIKSKSLYWLQEENFKKIQKMYRENKIHIIHQNIASPSLLSDLQSIDPFLINKIDTFYISNVHEWLETRELETEQKSLDQNLRFLSNINPDITIIYSADCHRKFNKGYIHLFASS
jgi:hypothetical protein